MQAGHVTLLVFYFLLPCILFPLHVSPVSQAEPTDPQHILFQESLFSVSSCVVFQSDFAAMCFLPVQEEADFPCESRTRSSLLGDLPYPSQDRDRPGLSLPPLWETLSPHQGLRLSSKVTCEQVRRACGQETGKTPRPLCVGWLFFRRCLLSVVTPAVKGPRHFLEL